MTPRRSTGTRTAAAISLGSASRPRGIRSELKPSDLLVRQDFLHEVGCDCSRCNSIHANAMRRSLACACCGEHPDRGLGDVVRRHRDARRREGRGRTDRDDAPRATGAHQSQSGLHGEEDALHVDGHDTVEIVLRRVHYATRMPDPGIANHHVEWSRPVDPSNRLEEWAGLRHVELNAARGSAKATERFACVLGACAVDVSDHDMVATCCEAFRRSRNRSRALLL